MEVRKGEKEEGRGGGGGGEGGQRWRGCDTDKHMPRSNASLAP